MGQEKQEVIKSSVVYPSPSQARWDVEQADPYHVFHQEVYAQFRRMKAGKKPSVTSNEAELLRLMARDSGVFQNHFAKLSATASKPAVLDFAANVASTIASFYKRPSLRFETQELLLRARQNPLFFENILIGLMAADPKTAFFLLEQIVSEEQKEQVVTIADEQDSLALASLITVGMLDGLEPSPQPQDSRKAAITKLLRAHLLQFEHVVDAAESQHRLRNLINTNLIVRRLWGEKILPYPGVPDLADRTISYCLEQYGFERVNGFEWKEVVEAAKPQRPRRARKAPKNSANS